MKGIIRIFRRFLSSYKRYISLAFISNILTAILNVFSFMTIIPILEILFKMKNTVYNFVAWSDASMSFSEKLSNNGYWYIGQIIERYGESNTLLIMSLVLVFMTLLKTAAAYFGSYFTIPIRTGVVRDIRNQINDKILILPIGFFSEERKGDILARISGDVNEVEGSVMSSLDMLFKNPILILFYLVTMIVTSWQLTIFVLILLPIMGYVMGVVGKSLKKQSFEAQNKWGELISQVEETLGGLRVIKAFTAENMISKRFHKGSETFRKMTHLIAARQYLAHPMSEFLGTITIAIVLWFGGSLILGGSGQISAATFIFYLIIFYSIINPAKEFSRSAYAIQRGLASMQRIDKILEAQNYIQDPESPKAISFQEEITYHNVWFKYREEWVLKNVNLTIPKGKTIALVGESGSGKSTMVDLLPRFYDVQKGEIRIDGTDIRKYKLRDVRSLMGYVNQEAILFNDSFANNIAFGNENASRKQIEEAARIANAHEFISATENGYDSNIGDRGGKLSGGQRQRISIARAVLKNPEILILDEATSALDTASEKLVQEALDNLVKNRTTIIIAHRLSTVKNADEIYVMKEGEIVERGHHDELYQKNGYYRKLCDVQIDFTK